MVKNKKINNFIECGPANVLNGLNRRISKEINTITINSIEEIINL